ncbi:unnamed protein product [Miscanthus lutarioriparius]|uniref:Stress-response A/B barrel domain-containing protein n=1 Tax=Miscanthus lutarioriparius TaxID=422564 RepID=A0A811P0S8_9POAL|nr:unnamed protein product [Miscanthus lutarioriparius]
MSVTASSQVPQPHTIRPVVSCFRLHQLSAQNLDRYRRWWGTGKNMILSTRGVLESSNGAHSSGLMKKRHCLDNLQGSVSVDFESEAEDDIIPIFHRGETASGEATEDALASLQKLISQCSSFTVQATCGCCLDHPDSGYSHAALIRFPSFDDLKLFRESMEYKDMWASKFHPVVERSLHLHFTLDPVGNQLM